MNITVMVPTYRRPVQLASCLRALQNQIRLADQVIVTVRDTDSETWAFLADFDALPLQIVTVKVVGVIAAMNAGLEVAQGDIIAFTDDDAVSHSDWLARIEAHFLADDRIGGVGGRDWVYHGARLEDGEATTVGEVQWFGRVIGNHHIGTGAAREVDVLKGVNMSFRRLAIQGLCFDDRMQGTGAQVHFEIAFSLKVKLAGWKVIYDPLIAVDHYPAQRFDEDQRIQFNSVAWRNAAHNETLALLDYLPTERKLIYLVWAVIVGTKTILGFVQLFRLLPTEGRLALQKWLASLQGRWQGVQTWNDARHRKLKKVCP